jgi:hypothetical protein
MSKHKSNVHPGQYKVAGRERQGEDVVHDRNKARLTQSQAVLEHQPHPELPAPREEPMPEKETREPSATTARSTRKALKRRSAAAR